MEYQFLGFAQKGEFRELSFDGVAKDRSKTRFTVLADLGLLRKHGIPVQELPLLCQSLLEKRPEGDNTHLLTLSEGAMKALEEARIAAKNHVSHRRPPRPVKTSTTPWQSPISPSQHK